MKEYMAETGGRYTYSDDVLNLQELSLSMSALFEGCSNFIISGCEVAGTHISSGYVWINGKVRRFGGCTDAVFPYYIYEKNSYDTITYANEVNKRGRCNHLCLGGAAVPSVADDVTGLVPQFIELKTDYSPRLIDKFFGKYALLLETPFAKQTIKKELALLGKLTGEKEIESKTAISVVHPANGCVLKNTVKENGDASVGVYLNGLPANEILLKTDGTFDFIKQGQKIAHISENGINSAHIHTVTSQSGSIFIYGSHIINAEDASDEGAVNVNISGYQKGGTKFRNFNVYNGKTASVALFQVEGKTGTVHVNGLLAVTGGSGITLSNKTFPKTDKRLLNSISWKDSADETVAFTGYDTDNSFDFTIKNSLGNIVIHPNGYLDVQGELKIGGTAIGSIYVTQTAFNTELAKKVTTVSGKGLSTEDFTTGYKDKLDAISSGNLTGSGGSGYALASEVVTELAKKLSKSENLADLPDKAAARTNISVYSKAEMDTLLNGKLSVSAAYTGEIFTSTHKTKLDGIKTGNFQGTNAQGQPVNQTEGYVLVSDTVKELAKKANLLLDNYNNDQKTTIAGNLNVYQKSDADAKFASLGNLFQDYINHLTGQGKSTTEAQQTLRDKLNVPGKEDVSDNYLRKDSRLSDLALADNNAKKQVCQKIGAAYADEYQTKLTDTGWLQMANSGNSTDTSRLFIRQTGHTVCIQGIINTAKRDGSNMGGTVAVIPNQVQPPKYGLRVSHSDYNDGHKYNRGSSFVIPGNTRKILIYESGWYNIDTEIHFTYMT